MSISIEQIRDDACNTVEVAIQAGIRGDWVNAERMNEIALKLFFVANIYDPEK
jgi:hypothetical protein